MELSASTDIDASASTVWNSMVDVESYPLWTTTMTRVLRRDGGPLALGSRVRITQPKLGTHEWTVTAIDTGAAFTWVTSKPGLTTAATHTIESHANGVRLRLSITLKGPLGWLVGRLYAGLTKRYLAIEAEGCKRWSEAREREHSTTHRKDHR